MAVAKQCENNTDTLQAVIELRVSQASYSPLVCPHCRLCVAAFSAGHCVCSLHAQGRSGVGDGGLGVWQLVTAIS